MLRRRKVKHTKNEIRLCAYCIFYFSNHETKIKCRKNKWRLPFEKFNKTNWDRIMDKAIDCEDFRMNEEKKR
jgi:hypothetical protein